MNTDTGYLSKTMAMIIHTYNGTTPYCLQSFSLFQMNNNNSIKYRTSNPWGEQIPRRHIKSAEGESINAWSVSNWARSKSHWVQMSIGGLIWLTPQPVDWRIHQNSSKWAKTCWGEREEKIPHKGCWILTLDLIWSPPSVKDLLDPVKLVHIWPISIKSAENPVI